METHHVLCELQTDSLYRLWFNYCIQADKHRVFISPFNKIVNLHMNKQIDFRREASHHPLIPGGVTPIDAL